MVPKIASRYRGRRERLRHLAIAFKVEIRLKIVIELYIRPMSPKDFYEEFGGGSLERIYQHFAELEKHGWLRRLGQKWREIKRRGRSGTLYRSIDTPFFDSETWASLPYSLRLAYSWNAFSTIAKELRRDIERSLTENRVCRDLTFVPLELDEVGWKRVIAKLDLHFESTFEEQEDTNIRVAHADADLARLGVLQIGFDAAPGNEWLAQGLADGVSEPPIPFPERLAPVMADDLAMDIVTLLNRRDMSVVQYHRELSDGATDSAVRYRFGRLKDLAWITVVDEIRRRGANEKIYRATKPAISDNGPWADVPETLAETKTWAAFTGLSDMVKQAIVAGTFDLREDRHLSWSIVNLDLRGQENVATGLNALEAFIDNEEREAAKRIAAGAEPLTMVVALGALESPIGNVKAP